MKAEQQIQEAQYEYPYHYIPKWANGKFSQTQHWSWGLRYLGGMAVVRKLIGSELDKAGVKYPRSLIDVGCGDGRFLREVSAAWPKTDLLGVDYSARGIALARALNPHLRYEQHDITSGPPIGRFAFATLVEVLEHVPIDQVPAFVAGVAKHIEPDGFLVVTVPHQNKPVSDKHFQHFTIETLAKALSPHFHNFKFQLFDDIRSPLLMSLLRLSGGTGRNFLVTNEAISSWIFRVYLSRYLYLKDERRCGRIAAICQPRAI